MLGWIKRRPFLCALIALPLLGYLGMIATMAVQQRKILFETDDGGRLAAAGGIAIAGSERVTLTTEDRQTLAAWYLAPSPGEPVFLFLHGQGGGLLRQVERWEHLKRAGYGVLAISYRGYPGSTGSPSETGLILDARAGYDWLRARFPADHIVIHGHSLGSGVATPLAAIVPARMLVLEAPFTAAVDIAAERMPLMPVYLLMRDQFRSRAMIGRVHIPVLIAHGERDGVIPFAHAERLLALANPPKRLFDVPGGTHNSLSRDGLYDAIGEVPARYSRRRRGAALTPRPAMPPRRFRVSQYPAAAKPSSTRPAVARADGSTIRRRAPGTARPCRPAGRLRPARGRARSAGTPVGPSATG